MYFSTILRREDKLPLVEVNKTPSKHKAYKSIVTQLSNVISATNNKRSSVKLDNGNGEICYYEIRDKIIIMLIVSPKVPVDNVFDVIGEVFKYFLLEYENKIDIINRPFAAISWQSSFEKIVKAIEEPVSKEKLTKIGEKLSSIENIMQENIKELIQRGQKLEKVQEYSDKAQIESQKFLQKTNWIRLKQKYQNKIIAGGIIFFFLLILIWYLS